MPVFSLSFIPKQINSEGPNSFVLLTGRPNVCNKLFKEKRHLHYAYVTSQCC